MKKNSVLFYSLFIISSYYHYLCANYGIITHPNEAITLYVNQNTLPIPARSIKINQTLQKAMAQQTKLLTRSIQATPLQDKTSPTFVVVPNTIHVRDIPIEALESIMNWTLAALKFPQPLASDGLSAITNTIVSDLSTEKKPLTTNLIHYLNYTSLLRNASIGQAITAYLLDQFKNINNFLSLEPADQRLFLMYAFPFADRFIELFGLLQQSSLLTNTLLHRYAFFAGQALPSIPTKKFDEFSSLLSQFSQRIQDRFISYLEAFLSLPVTLDQTINIAQQKPITALYIDLDKNITAVSNNSVYAINKKANSTSWSTKKIIQPTKTKHTELLPITTVVTDHDVVIFAATYQKPLQDRLLIWNTNSKKLQEFTTSQKITTLSQALSNHQSLLIGQKDGTISIFDYTQGDITISRKISTGAVQAIELCPGTTCAFVLAREENVIIAKIINLSNLETLLSQPISLNLDLEKQPLALAFGSHNDMPFSAQPLQYYLYFVEGTMVKALDIITGHIFTVAKDIGDHASTLAVNDDKSVVAVGFQNGSIKIFTPEPTSDNLFTMLRNSQQS